MEYIIRPYQNEDRGAVRKISCETAFLGIKRRNLFSDDEILADALTLYYTDYEPESCFVAASNNQVIAYLIGSRNISKMNQVSNSKILWPLVFKAFRRKYFLHPTNLRFLVYSFRSFIRGEFAAPNFLKEFPATLHINVDKDFVGQGIGASLIQNYLHYLRKENVPGLHFATLSEGAKDFFLAQGFQVLFQGPRSYLDPYVDRRVVLYILGRKL